jgi:hypothetical protein
LSHTVMTTSGGCLQRRRCPCCKALGADSRRLQRAQAAGQDLALGELPELTAWNPAVPGG